MAGRLPKNSRVFLVPGHLQITNTLVASRKTDRPFPIRKTRTHPACRVQGVTGNRQSQRWDRDVPAGRNFAHRDFRPRFWRHAYFGGGEQTILVLWREPFAGNEGATVGFA